MRIPWALLAVLAGSAVAQAADVEAGRDRVNSVCAACHGRNGVSVAAFIPNLAGQKAEYLTNQLQAFRGGDRKDDLMSAIASQLNDGDIDNVAAFFAGLPGPAVGASPSGLLPNVAETRVGFPADYKTSFARYMKLDFPETREVRHFYANPAAIQAARAGHALPDGSMILVEVYDARIDEQGNPVHGNDGFFEAAQLKGYAAMERQAGWGAALPDMLRNENWNYAPFTADRVIRGGFNQAICFACHKPRPEDSHLFTMQQLRAFARTN